MRARHLATFFFVAATGVFAVVGSVALALWRDLTGPPFGSDGPHSGWSARFAGDVDSDGTPDILLSTPFEPCDGGYGSVRWLAGSTAELLRTFPGAWHRAPGWHAMGAAGDFDGDRVDDVYVIRGAWCALVSGVDGSTVRRLAISTPSVLESLGDVDGDGCGDLLIGGYPEMAGRTRASVVSGRTGSTSWGDRRRFGTRLDRVRRRRREPRRRADEHLQAAWFEGGIADFGGDGRGDLLIAGNVFGEAA